MLAVLAFLVVAFVAWGIGGPVGQAVSWAALGGAGLIAFAVTMQIRQWRRWRR